MFIHFLKDCCIKVAMMFASFSNAFLRAFSTWPKWRTPRITRKISNGSRVGNFGIHLKYLQKSLKKRSNKTSEFHWFPIDVSSKKPSKIMSKTLPESNKKSSEKNNTFFNAFLIDFQLRNRSKMPPESSQKLPKDPSKKWLKTCLSKGTGSAFYFTDIPNFPKFLTVSLFSLRS